MITPEQIAKAIENTKLAQLETSKAADDELLGIAQKMLVELSKPMSPIIATLIMINYIKVLLRLGVEIGKITNTQE